MKVCPYEGTWEIGVGCRYTNHCETIEKHIFLTQIRRATWQMTWREKAHGKMRHRAELQMFLAFGLRFEIPCGSSYSAKNIWKSMQNHWKTQISYSSSPSHLTNEVERKRTRQNEAQGKKEGIAAKGRRQKDSNAAEGRRKVHQICRLFFMTQREQAHVRKKRFGSTCFFCSFWDARATGGQKADSHIIYNI